MIVLVQCIRLLSYDVFDMSSGTTMFFSCNTRNAPYDTYIYGSPRFRRQTVKVVVRTGAVMKNSRIL